MRAHSRSSGVRGACAAWMAIAGSAASTPDPTSVAATSASRQTIAMAQHRPSGGLGRRLIRFLGRPQRGPYNAQQGKDVVQAPEGVGDDPAQPEAAEAQQIGGQ